jgi:hypothetical protein
MSEIGNSTLERVKRYFFGKRSFKANHILTCRAILLSECIAIQNG